MFVSGPVQTSRGPRVVVVVVFVVVVLVVVVAGVVVAAVVATVLVVLAATTHVRPNLPTPRGDRLSGHASRQNPSRKYLKFLQLKHVLATPGHVQL
jgi:MFS superfamily sulfate permease-like transporter